MINPALALTFDDVSLVPQYSEVKSRKTPDVSTQLGTMNLEIPIVSSPMNTITEWKMMAAMDKLGGASVLHRYMSSDDQLNQILSCLRSDKSVRNFFLAVGATGDFLERAFRFYDTLGVKNFCIDVANGHSEICLTAVELLRKKIPNSNIMAGNICSREGALRLYNAGTNILRVGVGPGSVCKTRVVTGHGIPQVTAIDECCSLDREDVYVIADGGIRSSGDIVKALAAGADAVMVGGLLAGTDETPGEIIDHEHGHRFKRYAGMASKEGRRFNGWFSEEDASFIPEGEAVEIPYKGPTRDVISQLVGGLRSGMSYAGAFNIKDLQENAEWVRITDNGRIEGTPHAK